MSRFSEVHAQLEFDWRQAADDVAAGCNASPRSLGSEEASLCDGPHGMHGMVQVLPWDFRTSFPQPIPEAIDAGRICEEDVAEENLSALHEEHALHALTLLADLDAVLEARRLNVDPLTGRSPKTDKQRQRLENLFRDEPQRLERALKTLIDVYDEVFGREATDAFRKAIHAWHAGVTVTSENPPCLPPLPKSVEQGVFGHDEDGMPVSPGPDEIEAITESVTDKLRTVTDPAARQELLQKYAEDFGERGADALDAWTNAQELAEEGPSFDYLPGHPWHYYHEGDAAEPTPLEQIPPDESSHLVASIKLPKNLERRREKLRRILADSERQLKEDETRYTSLLENGVDALSAYDRQIAHGGNDELAWASAVALTYNHIRNDRGRILWLRQQLA